MVETVLHPLLLQLEERQLRLESSLSASRTHLQLGQQHSSQERSVDGPGTAGAPQLSHLRVVDLGCGSCRDLTFLAERHPRTWCLPPSLPPPSLHPPSLPFSLPPLLFPTSLPPPSTPTPTRPAPPSEGARLHIIWAY